MIKNVNIKKHSLMLAVFCTMSALDEDSPDGIPKKYHDFFRKLGNELIDIELYYDEILDELIELLGESL